MKNLTLKLIGLSILVLATSSSCTKQQYRARSKRYPHDIPKKQ